MSNIVIRILLNDDTRQVKADNFAHFITVALDELGLVGVVFVEKEEEDGTQGEGS